MRVSWSFIWGHFCLSYDGQKLLTDADDIGSYGIKDGDKLQFIRHLSISYNMVKEISEEEDLDLDKPTISEVCKSTRLNIEKDVNCNQRVMEGQQDISGNEKDRGLVTNCRYKLIHLFRGWFSYHKLPTSDMRIEEKNFHQDCPSFSMKF